MVCNSHPRLLSPRCTLLADVEVALLPGETLDLFCNFKNPVLTARFLNEMICDLKML